MSPSQCNKKLFGMALDASDDPLSLELKRAWMTGIGQDAAGAVAYTDPYDAVTDSIKDILDKRCIEPVGKFPVPSWLWPKPRPADLPLVTTANIGDFYDSGGLDKMLRRLERFVEKKIFPAMPVMLGIDHAATGSVVSALARKYGTDKLSVIVLDRHFDAIPLSVRLKEASGTGANLTTSLPFEIPNIPVGFKDQCCCGNFWDYLMKDGTVLPENLMFIGVGDYPKSQTKTGKDSIFRKTYLSFEERGCKFFPRWQFEGQYKNSLREFIGNGIKTPYLYVSLDLDVGAYCFTWAARYMDGQGISEKNLLDIAAAIAGTCRRKNVNLAGFDVMEFNMHFLGIETSDGLKDSTIATVGDFITALV